MTWSPFSSRLSGHWNFACVFSPWKPGLSWTLFLNFLSPKHWRRLYFYVYFTNLVIWLFGFWSISFFPLNLEVYWTIRLSMFYVFSLNFPSPKIMSGYRIFCVSLQQFFILIFLLFCLMKLAISLNIMI